LQYLIQTFISYKYLFDTLDKEFSLSAIFALAAMIQEIIDKLEEKKIITKEEKSVMVKKVAQLVAQFFP